MVLSSYGTVLTEYVVLYAFIIKPVRSYSNMNFNQLKALLNSPLLIQNKSFRSSRNGKTGIDNWLFDLKRPKSCIKHVIYFS
jgi:hypothetical protein